MYEVFAKTRSVCPVCLGTIDAEKAVAGDGFVHLIKTCPEHGFFDVLIWEGGADEYLAWGGAAASPEPEDDCPRSCGLCGNHESAGCCVLLELTHRCDLHCPVCFASAGGEGDLTIDEVAALYDMLMERGGPYNIQLSGGEPTMRDDLPEIVRLGRERGFSFFQLNTNGLRSPRSRITRRHCARPGSPASFCSSTACARRAMRRSGAGIFRRRSCAL